MVVVFRVPDAGDGVQSGIHGVGGGAAEQIDLVVVGHRNEQIRFLHARLVQHGHGGAVALDGDHVVALDAGIQNTGITIDDRDIVILAGELSGQRGTDLAVTGNDDFHKTLRK